MFNQEQQRKLLLDLRIEVQHHQLLCLNCVCVCLCALGVSALQAMSASTVTWIMMIVKKTSVRTEVSASMPSMDTPASVQRDTGEVHVPAGIHKPLTNSFRSEESAFVSLIVSL